MSYDNAFLSVITSFILIVGFCLLFFNPIIGLLMLAVGFAFYFLIRLVCVLDAIEKNTRPPKENRQGK
jgi:O-antigen/teichoic acid export membrane protein